jgi:hypothetical protein
MPVNIQLSKNFPEEVRSQKSEDRIKPRSAQMTAGFQPRRFYHSEAEANRNPEPGILTSVS